jgi:membrane protein
MLRDTVSAFIEDQALSRGAAIAFFTVTSIAPILLIVIAIAGLAFGQEAAQNAILGQLSGLMGQQTAEVLQTAIANASSRSSGILGTAIGMVTLLVTASGVFGEMQSALNAIWKVEPKGTTVSRLIRARAASLGLVAALGFLLLVSLVVSAGLTAFSNYLNAVLPFGKVILSVLNGVISVALISVMFAAIYKVLPDRPIEWRDVIVGAGATAILFTIGKALIGWYIGSSAVASSFGAAGALIILLLWIYYSVQIFLIGAEFTKIYANRKGSKQDRPVAEGGDAARGRRALGSADVRAEPRTARPASPAWLAIPWIIAAAVRLVGERRRKRRSQTLHS